MRRFHCYDTEYRDKTILILTRDDIELLDKDFTIGGVVDVLVLPSVYRNYQHEKLINIISITKIRKGQIIYV